MIISREEYELLVKIDNKSLEIDNDNSFEIKKLFIKEKLISPHLMTLPNGKLGYDYYILTPNAKRAMEEYEKSQRTTLNDNISVCTAIESNERARSANDIAREANRKSRNANIIAIVSGVISLGSLITAIVSIILSLCA